MRVYFDLIFDTIYRKCNNTTKYIFNVGQGESPWYLKNNLKHFNV